MIPEVTKEIRFSKKNGGLSSLRQKKRSERHVVQQGSIHLKLLQEWPANSMFCGE